MVAEPASLTLTVTSGVYIKNDYSFENKVQTLKNNDVFTNVLVIWKIVQRFSQASI